MLLKKFVNEGLMRNLSLSSNFYLVGVARYYEEENYLWQTKEFRVPPYEEIRIYDYSTMQVHSLGKTDRCTVTVDSWLEDTPDQIETVEILIKLQDGQWYLDNFIA